jgi:hypothetical protein
LVTGDNRIICLQNGFLPLDKSLYMGDTTYSVDQLEAHQTGRIFPRLYGAVINFNFVRMFKVSPNFKPVAAYMALVRKIQHFLGSLFTPENFHVRFADTRREFEADRPPKSPVPSGIIAIKYWPIDTYARQFSEDLPERIEEGYLLNDLVYFVSEGLVTLWDKNKTRVDEVDETIERNGESIHYDYLIRGDVEVPNLPRITYERDGQTVDYDGLAAGPRVSGISGSGRRRRGISLPSRVDQRLRAGRCRGISASLRILGHDSRCQQLPLLRREVPVILVVHTAAVEPGIGAADIPDRFPGDVCPATTSGSALPVQRSQEQEKVPRVLPAVSRSLQSRAASKGDTGVEHRQPIVLTASATLAR